MSSGNSILITGMPHSGTRLIIRMMRNNKELSIPDSYNGVEESDVLHNFFIRSMDRTSLESKNYNINKEELKFIISSIKKRKKWAIKMPAYPLMCIEDFVYSMPNLRCVVYNRRPKEKVISSFKKRNEHKTLFKEVSEKERQIKKTLKIDRKKTLAQY